MSFQTFPSQHDAIRVKNEIKNTLYDKALKKCRHLHDKLENSLNDKPENNLRDKPKTVKETYLTLSEADVSSVRPLSEQNE